MSQSQQNILYVTQGVHRLETLLGTMQSALCIMHYALCTMHYVLCTTHVLFYFLFFYKVSDTVSGGGVIDGEADHTEGIAAY